MHLADLRDLDADERMRELYANPDDWVLMAILSVAGSGRFSSDRTVAEFNRDLEGKGVPCGLISRTVARIART